MAWKDRASSDKRARQAVELTDPPPHPYTLGEDIANSVTHGIGVAFSISAMTLLIAFAAWRGDRWGLASAIVFGTSLVLLYTGSTLYHSMRFPKAREVFKLVDHCAIFVLIAGTYTPFTLVTLRPAGGWWMFAAVWTFALAGMAMEAFWTTRPRWLSLVVYLGMGWMVVFMLGPVRAALDPAGVLLLIAGGLSYTVGTVFYALKRIPYFHMVWHLFVLGGSVCHFLAVLLYVIPVKG